jgi:hypothetical protein
MRIESGPAGIKDLHSTPELYGGCSAIGCNHPWHRDEESGEMAVLGVEMWDRYRSRMLRSSRAAGGDFVESFPTRISDWILHSYSKKTGAD